MRRYIANDRRIANEVTAANVDAPERATYVVTDTNPVAPTDLEVGCEAGTVVIDGDEVSVSAQTESVSDIAGEVSETAYRYHTVSVDATGTLVVRSSDVGEFDADAPDAEPITQVTEPSHGEGEAFLGTAFQVEGTIERVFDGRYVLDGVPNSVITQGEGSGLTAEFVEPQGEGSGLDADTLRGETPNNIRSPIYGDGSDGDVVDTGTASQFINAETYTIDSSDTVAIDEWVYIRARESITINGTLDATGAAGNGGPGGSGGDDGTATNGSAGGDGLLSPLISAGSGGDGGASAAGDGGSGGDGDTRTLPHREQSLTPQVPFLDELANTTPEAAAGGGGGGGGVTNADTNADGTDGSPPGGGGGGRSQASSPDVGGDGGDGGDGGGLVILVAPQIEINGSILADGEPGSDGIETTGGGGGGGGGSGGVILLFASDVSTPGTLSVSPGVGGAGLSSNGVAGDGADGASGEVIVVSNN